MSNFTIIQYLGNQAGPVPYFGKATKIMYRFGIFQRKQPVHSDDVAGFLAILEGRQAAFALVDVSLPVVEETTQPDDTQPHDDGNPLDVPFDFTLLSGIGPAKHQLLQEAGILTKPQFLAASTASLVSLLTANEKAVLKWKELLAQ